MDAVDQPDKSVYCFTRIYTKTRSSVSSFTPTPLTAAHFISNILCTKLREVPKGHDKLPIESEKHKNLINVLQFLTRYIPILKTLRIVLLVTYKRESYTIKITLQDIGIRHNTKLWWLHFTRDGYIFEFCRILHNTVGLILEKNRL